MNFSPNFTSSNIRPMTPIYGPISPEISKMFIFNNSNSSLTPTPLPIKNSITEYQNSNRKKVFAEPKETFKFDHTKEAEEINEQTPLSKFKKEPEEDNIFHNKIHLNNYNIPGVVYVPNNEFYSWAIDKSQSNRVRNKTNKSIKIDKIKKTKWKNCSLFVDFIYFIYFLLVFYE